MAQTLKMPVADEIRQLIISPNNNFLAVATTHTVHVVVIPDSSHLSSTDTSILRPKTWQLGPTVHVTSRGSLASALWHPLGVNGNTLVTVSTDAVVRVWELSISDRWSFDAPTVSIDLTRLADGKTLDEDFSASTSRGAAFTPDSVEMQVAAATFASRGSGDWCPMTLWIAMREGDIYALCPLLPRRWAPPSTLIPSLSVSVITKIATLEDAEDVSERTKLLAQQQLDWMGEIDSQEPTLVDSPPGEPPTEVYNRPSRPGVIPRLQGPFHLKGDYSSEDVLDDEFTDIVVIGKKIDLEDLMTGEDLDIDLTEGEQEGSSLTLVCLLSTSGQVRAYLDVGGVEAQWLPPKSKARLVTSSTPTEDPVLLAFQCIDTMTPVEVEDHDWPLFSPDVSSKYDFFVTHQAGITFLSLASWVIRLESDLSADSPEGSDFRLGLLAGSHCTRERIMSRGADAGTAEMAACVTIRDPDLGYMLLSATPFEPLPVTFEAPEYEVDLVYKRDDTPVYEESPVKPQLDVYEPRPVFRPHHVFEEDSSLPNFLYRLRSSQHKTLVNQELRLSPATLNVFTDVHKILSQETHQLGLAAAELFRRCEMLQTDLRDQVVRVGELAASIGQVSGKDDDNGESDRVRFQRRMEEARQRQDRLSERVENMRKTVGRGAPRPLTDKEKAFAEEIRALEDEMLGTEAAPGTGPKQKGSRPSQRLHEVKQLMSQLSVEAAKIKREKLHLGDNTNNGSSVTVAPSSPSDLRIPAEIRKAKLQQVRGLLDRESAMVEAVTERLQRLKAVV